MYIFLLAFRTKSEKLTKFDIKELNNKMQVNNSKTQLHVNSSEIIVNLSTISHKTTFKKLESQNFLHYRDIYFLKSETKLYFLCFQQKKIYIYMIIYFHNYNKYFNSSKEIKMIR